MNCKQILLFLCCFLFSPCLASPVSEWEAYLSECEHRVGETWTQYSVHDYKIPEHFRKNAKGVIGFSIDAQGKVSKAKVIHSSAESLRVAAYMRYPHRADGLMKAMDYAMLNALETSAPLPPPPRKLYCPRRFVAVFDTHRFNPLRIYIDDKIPIYGSSIPQVFLWR